MGLTSDPFVSPNFRYGQPVFVHALRKSNHDEWLVPVVQGGSISGVVSVSVFPDGTGNAGIFTPWRGAFPHNVSSDAGLAAGSTATDPGRTVELAWAVVDPRSGGPANEVTPFYVVTRASGAQVLVMESGNVVDASAAAAP